MADDVAQADDSQKHQEQTPLLIIEQTQEDHRHRHHQQQRPQQRLQTSKQAEEDVGDEHLDKSLQRLDCFLSLLGFNQSTALSRGISWAVFVVIGVSLPVAALLLSDCLDCERYQIKAFELVIVASQACLAAISLLCLSHNLRKYGIRKFLFVDHCSGQMERFRESYIQKISVSVRLLVLWILSCSILKTIREIIRVAFVHHDSWWHSGAILLVLVVSWTYVTTVFLSACILFHLVCSLQIIHFEDFGKLLETESDVSIFMKEHIRLRFYLSKISHRFRIFLLLEFLFVTASQSLTLFQTTGYGGIVTPINGGDFAVSSIVQVVGIILCLNGAAKISHRAQGIASIASQWHATLTCSSTDASQMRISSSMENLKAANALGSLFINYSESDLESLVCTGVPTNIQQTSCTSSYHKRQAFVTYLQSNPGGITIFGWTADRGLIHTIFFIELSLVLFVLGKTVVSTSE